MIKKVDAAAGKLYIEMKDSRARLVLRADNVQPVAKQRRGARKT